MSNHVLLFRLPSSEDEYHLQLSFHGYSPHSISPLDTELCNIERLADFIYSDSVSGSTNQHGFDGVIITSSRSIEALVAAIQSRKHGENKYLSKWRGTSFYVVGSKTASFLHQALSGTSLRPDDIRILGATESGNAEKLAEFIINTIGDRKQRLLYLTGDKNRDTLSNKLNEGRSNIELVSLQVYATCESAFLRNEIEKYGREMRPDPYPEPTGVPNIWIVFFAPSSSAYALPHLKNVFQLPFLKPSSESEPTELENHDFFKPRAIPVAIGPTTATYLRDRAGLQLEIVCKKPEAAALVAAIENYRLNR